MQEDKKMPKIPSLGEEIDKLISPCYLDKEKIKLALSFHCPGCGYSHFIQINPEAKPCWTINTKNGKLTVSPSILVQGQYRCHTFITNNTIRYLNDSTHHLKGQTIDMVPF